MEKLIICLLAILCLSSCASNKAFQSSTCVTGLELAYPPDSYFPTIRFGFITHDMAYVPEGEYSLTREWSDGVLAETTSGTIKKTIKIKNNQSAWISESKK